MTTKILGLALFATTLMSASLPLPSFAHGERGLAAATQEAPLSAYDQMIIKLYTASAYEFINNRAEILVDTQIPGIRGPIFFGEPEAEEPELKYYLQLQKALSRLTPYSENVYRGVYSSVRPEDRYPVGRVYFERRFSSTSKSLAVATSFAEGAYSAELRNLAPEDRNIDPSRSVLITIKSRTGRDVTKFAADQGEEEVLFPPSIFKVVSAKRDAKNRYLVQIEELDPNNLSAADKAALQKSEQARFDKLTKDLSLPAIGRIYKVWKQRYQEWSVSGYLDREDLTEDMFVANE